jgi:hypothetical protein
LVWGIAVALIAVSLTVALVIFASTRCDASLDIGKEREQSRTD